MVIILIRSLILYVLLISSVKLMGKRQLGELQPSEFVITMLLSNIATLSLEDANTPLIVGTAPILALVCFEVITSWLTLKSPKLRGVVSGRPKVIISNGKIDKTIMRTLRLSVDDLFTALRQSGIFSLDEVQYGIVETAGNISFMKKPEYESATRSDLKIPQNNPNGANPQQTVISDGRLLPNVLREIGLNEQWLNKILAKENYTVKEVFIMTADSNGEYYITGGEKA